MIPDWLAPSGSFPPGSLLSSCHLLADAAFPRGPGFYYHPAKVLAVLAVYLCWVRTCWWVSLDSKENGLAAELWNSALLGAGVLGLFLVWLIPWFLLSFPLLLLLYLSGALSYVAVRNEAVAPGERVLTGRHLRGLARRWFKLKMPEKAEPVKRRIPIRFIGKSESSREDPAGRVARVQESGGYQAALELVYDAIQRRATDIHLEPTREEMTVRFRVDGILRKVEPLPRATGDGVVNIFKVLADLDITEKRKPQDGSFSAEVRDDGARGEPRQVDFRVATAGSVAGEKLVMRILDRSRQVVNLSQLGMNDRMRERVRELVTRPHGMFMVCGPTGAGKSTTLYACLEEIDRYQKNVITVENPVEYHIDNVTQIEVNPKAGKTFASELRSILRQDPDVIYIGEVRDVETAEIALQAAQTGHMVFTTLHANDTVTSLARLLDLGIKPFLVGSAVSGVLSQRLVRLLCPRCKQRYRPNPDLLRKAGLSPDKVKYFYRPPEPPEESDSENVLGVCPECDGAGYVGRTGIYELLVLTDRIRDLIRENPNLNAIRQEAIKNGMRSLMEDGLLKVIDGETSIQELLRVCK